MRYVLYGFKRNSLARKNSSKVPRVPLMFSSEEWRKKKGGLGGLRSVFHHA